jgi:hypothetical protein
MARNFYTNIEMNGNRITGLVDGVGNDEPATVSQLNAAVEGRSYKAPVRAASTANLTLSGAQTVDGVSLIAGDRILVKNQSTAANNGIYVVAAGAWPRSTDASTAAEVRQMAMYVQEGTTQADTSWVGTANDPITLGVTSLPFVQTGAGTSYSEGNGIDITGTTISVDATVVGRKASAVIGNGSATSFTVNHLLNSIDVQVSVWETSGSLYEVFPDVAATDANNVEVSFNTAPASGEFRVSIIG